MLERYIVWFKGSDMEPPSICYKGKEPFFTYDASHAKQYAEQLQERTGDVVPPDSFKVYKLVEVE